MTRLDIGRPMEAVRMHAKGMSKAEIARRLRTGQITVAGWIESFEHNHFGMDKGDVRFLAEVFGLLEGENNGKE